MFNKLKDQSNYATYQELREIAREMRRKPTEAESRLWLCLRCRKLGVKFRRQHVIDQFIADFFCFERSLIIEVDGEIHEQQVGRDKERDNILRSLGYKVIRFRNEDVMQNIQVVISKIKNELHNFKISNDSQIPKRGLY